eukprot:3144014-Rhodomonas_salina.2
MDSKAADLQAVKNVVQMVARSFFGPEEIAVLDGLLFLTGPERQSIQDEELAKELHLQHKVVRAALSRLERACLVRSFERKEMKGVKEIQQQVVLSSARYAMLGSDLVSGSTGALTTSCSSTL